MTAPVSPTIPGVTRTFQVSATRRIEAPASAVYAVFADYEVAHPSILPPRFFVGLTVVEGGQGAGTVIDVAGRAGGRVRVIRGIVSEPEPGRLLVESYPAERMVTSFRVEPDPTAETAACEVTITTAMRRRRGPLGWLEAAVVRRLLAPVFAEELDLVARYLAGDRPTDSAAT